MTTKHILKPMKFFFLILIIALIIIAFNGVVCQVHAEGIKGNIELSDEFIFSEKQKDVVIFGELKNYYEVPEGYKVAAIGEFKTGIITLKCSYNYILECSLSLCEKKKYHGFGLVDIKRPDIINDCYRAKIIFFVAIE